MRLPVFAAPTGLVGLLDACSEDDAEPGGRIGLLSRSFATEAPLGLVGLLARHWNDDPAPGGRSGLLSRLEAAVGVLAPGGLLGGVLSSRMHLAVTEAPGGLVGLLEMF